MKMEKINGEDPAFPCQSDLHGKAHNGFSKREEYANSALAGIDGTGMKPSEIAERAFRIADAMIERSNIYS